MRHKRILFGLMLVASICFFSSCRKDSSPTSSNGTPTPNPSPTPNPVSLYITVTQNTPACPLTLSFSGPTTFQDNIDTLPRLDYPIATNIGYGNYSFYFNGVTDGVLHSLSGAETITCSPSVTTSCGNWTYTVQP